LVILRHKVAGLSSAALERFVLSARKVVRLKGQVDVLVTNNAEMRALNRRFRKKNKPTDVLSFPSATSAKIPRTPEGELAISAEIAAQNAARLGHSTAQEVRILALHGILHLAGFDHESDNGEMARKELQLRQKLRLPSGLIERTSMQRTATKKTRSSRSRKIT
jgi:probable rRNA maturation factor